MTRRESNLRIPVIEPNTKGPAQTMTRGDAETAEIREFNPAELPLKLHQRNGFMRLLYTESSRNFGGKELRTLEEMEWLRRHGHKVCLAAAEQSAISIAAAKRGLNVIPVAFRGSINPGAILRLFNACLRFRPHLLITHESRDATAAWIVSRLMRVPTARYLNICRRPKTGFVHRLLWRFATPQIVATSESIRQRLLKTRLVPDNRIRVAGEFVDTSLFHPRVPPGGVRQKHGIPEEAFLITHIGMIRPDKGQRVLIQAVDDILKQHPECWFMFVGSATRPEYLEELKRHLRGLQNPGRVVFAGFQTDIPPFIAASDLICLTSLLEAQSKIIPQAFAMNKLVVATRVGGIPELVDHGKNGLLYEAKNPAALVESINEVFRCDREALAARGLERALKMDIDLVMKNTEAFYESMIP